MYFVLMTYTDMYSSFNRPVLKDILSLSNLARLANYCWYMYH